VSAIATELLTVTDPNTGIVWDLEIDPTGTYGYDPRNLALWFPDGSALRGLRGVGSIWADLGRALAQAGSTILGAAAQSGGAPSSMRLSCEQLRRQGSYSAECCTWARNPPVTPGDPERYCQPGATLTLPSINPLTGGPPASIGSSGLLLAAGALVLLLVLAK
jgi:hypothetical protein